MVPEVEKVRANAEQRRRRQPRGRPAMTTEGRVMDWTAVRKLYRRNRSLKQTAAAFDLSVNALDRCSRRAQEFLLSYLDRLPPARALLGTSNLQLDLLTERFQTRFQAVKLLPPGTEELAAFITAHWPVPRQTALQGAVGSGGSVRAALADLESWLDSQT